MGNYYSGTSGLVLPVPNKQHYPIEFKDKSRLTYYASLFNSIEINSSFYKVPQAKTVAKWANDVPGNFKFTFKLWQGITHQKGLAYNNDDILHFMKVINTVGEKKGCLLLQFPPSARAHVMPQLQILIDQIIDADADRAWKLAVELRHPSWYNEYLSEFAEKRGVSVVIQDMPASATPITFADQEDVTYLRFHGPDGRYSGSYADDVLQEYSSYINEWLSDGKTVYVYFNNTAGDAVKNLTKLNSFITRRHP